MVTQIPYPPSISRKAFACPHCGAYAAQTWFSLSGSSLPNPPATQKHAQIERIRSDEKSNEAARAAMLQAALSELPGVAMQIGPLGKDFSPRPDAFISNIHLSWCVNCCKKPAIWVHDTLIFPFNKDGPAPHADMPPDIVRDYEEARTILKMSPRGAAALLRLCVQKLCDVLGQEGKKIDSAIAALVAEGLSPVIEQALDSVRVIGNESVHPGVMDIRDDPETVQKLFGLVNLIVDRMIHHPKQVAAVYGTLPPEKKEGIKARNAKAAEQK
jgi:Domain of unknown function (DUF4145)